MAVSPEEIKGFDTARDTFTEFETNWSGILSELQRWDVLDIIEDMITIEQYRKESL